MRRLASSLSVAIATVALALGGAIPANAATPSEIEISTDGGLTWYVDGAPALFTSLGQIVPGGSQSASVEVRNTSSTPAVLRLAQIVAPTASPDFVADLRFGARTASVVGLLVQDVPLGVCTTLFDGQSLAAGQTATIDITVTLDEASNNASQRGVAPIEFIVSLVEATGGALPPVSCVGGAASGGDRPAVMANTGTDWMSTVGIGGALAVALLGGGFFALLAGRRRRRTT